MHIEVTPGSYVMIAVSDTGSGIAPKNLERVFDPFFTTKEVGKGTGLGLSMVYGLVKQSNGHIKIYSEEGHGTSVKIYLPRATGVDHGATEMPALAPVQGGHEAILVVEDDALVRKYVRDADPQPRLLHAGGRQRRRSPAGDRQRRRRSICCSPT